jgi:hypothetical protein
LKPDGCWRFSQDDETKRNKNVLTPHIHFADLLEFLIILRNGNCWLKSSWHEQTFSYGWFIADSPASGKASFEAVFELKGKKGIKKVCFSDLLEIDCRWYLSTPWLHFCRLWRWASILLTLWGSSISSYSLSYLSSVVSRWNKSLLRIWMQQKYIDKKCKLLQMLT